MRLRYGKNIVETGMNFAIAGYRYSTDGFYTINEVLNSYGRNVGLIERRCNRAELVVSQRLGDTLGSLSASVVREDYWNSHKTMKSYGVSYSNSFNGVSYSLGYTYSLNYSRGVSAESGIIF